jgi:hypothetical protein
MDLLLQAIDNNGGQDQDVEDGQYGDDASVGSNRSVDSNMSDFDDALEVDPWIKVWDPTSLLSKEAFIGSEPKTSIKKTNTVKCTLYHDHDSPLALEKHKMKSRLTACKSSRCHFDDGVGFCEARYKINVCEEDPEVCVIFQQGGHIAELGWAAQ